MSRYLNLADGQLESSSATLLTAPGEGAMVHASFTNTGSSKQTIILTVLRSGSTARRIARVTLEKDESHYIDGLPLSPSDVLAGYATYADAVDYVIAQGTGPFSMMTRDADGFPKSSGALEVTLPDDGNMTGGDVKISGLLEEIRDVLLKIA